MGTKLSLKLNLTIRKEVTILASAKRSSGTAHLEVTVDTQESTQEKKTPPKPHCSKGASLLHRQPVGDEGGRRKAAVQRPRQGEIIFN